MAQNSKIILPDNTKKNNDSLFIIIETYCTFVEQKSYVLGKVLA